MAVREASSSSRGVNSRFALSPNHSKFAILLPLLLLRIVNNIHFSLTFLSIENIYIYISAHSHCIVSSRSRMIKNRCPCWCFLFLACCFGNMAVHAKPPSSVRDDLWGILQKNPSKDPKLQEKFGRKLQAYVEDAGDDDIDDTLVAIGKSVFGIDIAPVTPEKLSSSITTTTSEPPVIMSFEYMTEFIYEVFLVYGCTKEQAAQCADVLIESDKRGIDSHGLGRLKPIYCDRMDQGILWANKPITIIKETETTALVDGNLGLGLYIGPYCMELAIQKAKKYGVGFVACQQSTHYGIAGYYATMASEQGCIGLSGTNARPSIAPTFGVEPMLGTNPLCFGIPSDEEFPFVIDCATSVNQRGKIERYGREGLPTPRGCVIDLDGIERTDTDGILKDMVLGKCALTPLGGAGDSMGGYKGYGWATTVELLCTAFQSGPFGEDVCGIDRETGQPKPMPLGHFFLAIDIEAVCGDRKKFEQNTGNLLRALRASTKSPKGPGRIWTAGEKEQDARLERTAQGGMVVSKPLQQNMIDLRNKHPALKEKYPKFPFED